MRLFLIIFAFAIALGCSDAASTREANVSGSNGSSSVPAKAAALPVYGYEIVNTYPHDPQAFTQGLLFHDGFLYESTGEFGHSSLRKVEIDSGKVLNKIDMPSDKFAEGITLFGDKIYQLSWREGIARVYDIKDFRLIREFNYQGEGWGITTDGTNLFMTDRTHIMRVLNPDTFRSTKMLAVMREDGKPLMQINELEYVKGEIWANIWHSEDPEILGKPNHIARIDPATGKLTGWINLDGISPEDERRDIENTLNGIAYDPASERIFVTGKKWKKLYEIRITPPKA